MHVLDGLVQCCCFENILTKCNKTLMKVVVMTMMMMTLMTVGDDDDDSVQ